MARVSPSEVNIAVQRIVWCVRLLHCVVLHDIAPYNRYTVHTALILHRIYFAGLCGSSLAYSYRRILVHVHTVRETWPCEDLGGENEPAEIQRWPRDDRLLARSLPPSLTPQPHHSTTTLLAPLPAREGWMDGWRCSIVLSQPHYSTVHYSTRHQMLPTALGLSVRTDIVMCAAHHFHAMHARTRNVCCHSDGCLAESNLIVNWIGVLYGNSSGANW